MMVSSAAKTLLNITHSTYGPQSDFTSMAKVVEGWTGVEIKG